MLLLVCFLFWMLLLRYIYLVKINQTMTWFEYFHYMLYFNKKNKNQKKMRRTYTKWGVHWTASVLEMAINLISASAFKSPNNQMPTSQSFLASLNLCMINDHMTITIISYYYILIMSAIWMRCVIWFCYFQT